MEIKPDTTYYIEKSLTKIHVKFIYKQTDDWVSFFGYHYSQDGSEIGYPRQHNFFKQYINVNWKEIE